ncbi:MAG: hypothetical protein ACT4QE_17760, partial [Anaerolineales bacterium]
KHADPGDVDTIWIKPVEKSGRVKLLLRFIRPSRCSVLLDFDILEQGGLVDCIVTTQCLYLQCGQRGDRFETTVNEDRIIVEVPSKGFREVWDGLLHGTLEKDFQKRGFKKKEAQSKAQDVVTKWRIIASTRVRRT